MGSPAVGRHEAIFRIYLDRDRSVKPGNRFHFVEQSGDTGVLLNLITPIFYVPLGSFVQDDADSVALSLQPQSEVEHPDIAAKHIFEVNRRQQDIHAFWMLIRDVQSQT